MPKPPSRPPPPLPCSLRHLRRSPPPLPCLLRRRQHSRPLPSRPPPLLPCLLPRSPCSQQEAVPAGALVQRSHLQDTGTAQHGEPHGECAHHGAPASERPSPLTKALASDATAPPAFASAAAASGSRCTCGREGMARHRSAATGRATYAFHRSERRGGVQRDRVRRARARASSLRAAGLPRQRQEERPRGAKDRAALDGGAHEAAEDHTAASQRPRRQRGGPRRCEPATKAPRGLSHGTRARRQPHAARRKLLQRAANTSVPAWPPPHAAAPWKRTYQGAADTRMRSRTHANSPPRARPPAARTCPRPSPRATSRPAAMPQAPKAQELQEELRGRSPHPVPPTPFPTHRCHRHHRSARRRRRRRCRRR